jgi:hypothetical protein
LPALDETMTTAGRVIPAGMVSWVGIRFALRVGGTKPWPWGLLLMSEFNFEPIVVNSTAPGGACTLRSFDDIGAFILNRVDVPRRLSGHWHAVRQDLPQARFGARRAKVHAAMRAALAAEEWLAD